MRGYRFYEELAYKGRKSETSVGNVVAVDVENGVRLEQTADGHVQAVYDGVGSVYFSPDSPCASTSISRDYLRDDCRRISEARARELHPLLFAYLEAGV